uniref:Venom peptide Hta1 n=1 Tax=Hadogenes troglodytes TaxID=1577150 RepID=A0A1B3IJ67_9SCOR|nr:venom peptide Hta1 [Hadogenes troglodytes]
MVSKSFIFLMVVVLVVSTFCSSYAFPAKAYDMDDDDFFDSLFDEYDDADDEDSFGLDLDPASMALLDMFANLLNDDFE